MLDEHDHRSLGQRLELFHMQEEAPGMVFWHPKGLFLYRLLEERARRQLELDGYREVRSPQLVASSIWETSSHWEHFRENMFVMSDDERSFALKPVSCPGHIQIFRSMVPSYRDLPLRLAEFGIVHRNERSGSLHGLFRLRQFTQDDGHVFCKEGQVLGEVARFCRSLRVFYEQFGFADMEVAFSGRPAQRAGSDEVWDRAESLLREAARCARINFREQPGEGAFYGPKLEFVLKDRLAREWQCGTIQLDFVLPERFDISFVDSGGMRKRPVMLHRALFGSLERFLGVLLEHHDGALPPWICPDQVVVATVGPGALEYAAEVESRLSAKGIRVRSDHRSESLSRKIVDGHALGAPYIVVVGKRERECRAAHVRERGGAQRSLGLEEAVLALSAACSLAGGSV
jgi:threonyl-tRNA synthetase